MKMNSIAKGIAAGAAAGTICYFISDSSKHRKNKLKRNAIKAVKSIAAVMTSMTNF